MEHSQTHTKALPHQWNRNPTSPISLTKEHGMATVSHTLWELPPTWCWPSTKQSGFSSPTGFCYWAPKHPHIDSSCKNDITHKKLAFNTKSKYHTFEHHTILNLSNSDCHCMLQITQCHCLSFLERVKAPPRETCCSNRPSPLFTPVQLHLKSTEHNCSPRWLTELWGNRQEVFRAAKAHWESLKEFPVPRGNHRYNRSHIQVHSCNSEFSPVEMFSQGSRHRVVTFWLTL